MSKIQEMFSANGRALFPSEIPLVEEFNAKYAEQLDPDGTRTQGQPGAETKKAVPPLQPLSAFHEAQAGLAWQAREEPVAMSLREGERFVLQFQEASVPLGYQIWRGEELGNQGVFAAEADSKEFAEALVEALGDRLSICDLEQLAAAFTAKLAQAEASRQAAIAEHRAKHGPAATPATAPPAAND